MSMDVLAYGMPGWPEWIIILFISSIAFVLPVIAFWKIFAKAGFPGALGLLMLVPIANVILSLYLAFAQWPALRSQEQ